MLDLALFSQAASTASANLSTHLLANSRRPAILTYASQIVDTANKISRIPLYVIGWWREAENLKINMIEGIEFARGWKNIPGSLRLGIQSQERMQIYTARVRFDARFTGLRWMVYQWRVLSFLIFCSMFWVVSMMSTSLVWFLLASHLGSGIGGIKKENIFEGDEISDGSVKAESEDEVVDDSSSAVEFPVLERSAAIKEEPEIEESSTLIREAGSGF